MILTDDPIRDYARYDYEQAEKEKKFPICSLCGERIYEEKAVKLDGEFICDDCIEDMKEYITIE